VISVSRERYSEGGSRFRMNVDDIVETSKDLKGLSISLVRLFPGDF